MEYTQQDDMKKKIQKEKGIIRATRASYLEGFRDAILKFSVKSLR